MVIKEIKAIAKEMGIVAGNRKKLELIQAIQEAEGNYPCFGTSNGSCDQQDCRWRDDCLK